MKNRILYAVLLASIPGVASAQEAPGYQCINGDLERRVQVMYETGVTVPCEVHYYKETEAPGDAQVLWRALNEEGYCESKASEFVAKLEGWGWSCSETGSSEAAPAEEADDTDALAPSDDTTGDT